MKEHWKRRLEETSGEEMTITLRSGRQFTGKLHMVGRDVATLKAVYPNTNFSEESSIDLDEVAAITWSRRKR
jgi:hypothetical protein